MPVAAVEEQPPTVVRIRIPIRPPGAPDEVTFDADCGRCGDCLAVCPEAILVRGTGDLPEIDPRLGTCTGCGLCADVCSYDVIRPRVSGTDRHCAKG